MPFRPQHSIRMIQANRCASLVLIALVTISAAKPDLLSLARTGQQLTDDQAKKLQSDLAGKPDDADLSEDKTEIQAQLLGYELSRKADLRSARLAGILWMIDHRTTDPITGSVYCQIDAVDNAEDYTKAKHAWDAQLTANPGSAAIAANAAAYYASSDFDAAVALLQQAIAIEPKNADWPERLARIYERRFRKLPDEAPRLAPLALQLRQSAYNLTNSHTHRFAVLVCMPQDAIAAGDLIAAKRYAHQLLGTAPKFKTSAVYGDAIYWGNLALGQIAFQSGRLDDAEDDLSNAGQSPGSEDLANTGPDFTLAKGLLARGERTPVHNYLLACKKLWPAGAQRLDAWLGTLDSGGTPDF
jgi:tetratricopeptide (TPR) repeat protein